MSGDHDPWPMGAVQRWDLNIPHRDETFHWMPGTHVKHFPYGIEFEPVQPEPQTFPSPHVDTPPEGLLWTLGPHRGRIGKPWRLRGPFRIVYQDGRPFSLTALGGVIEHQEPQVLRARSVRLTRLDADGQPIGPSRVMQGVADVLVTLRPAVEDAAVAVGHLAHATITATAQLKRFTYSRVLNAFYLADRVLTWTRDNRPVWIHRSWLRPGPAMGLTRRQKRATRSIRRRRTR